MTPHDLLANFETLAEAPNGIQRLRELVLELAVRGKLVEQDPTDEPANVLLKRLGGSHTRSGIRRNFKEAIETNSIRPYDLPNLWQWANLGVISTQITDGTHHTPTYLPYGVPFISIKDISGGSIDFSNSKFISNDEHCEINRRCNPERGDILICRIGTLGKSVVIETDVAFSLFVSVGLIKMPKSDINSNYIKIVLNSPMMWDQFQSVKAGGSHTQKLNLGVLPSLAIPVPPLAEQRRIVARVDELMALLDRLEAKRKDREAARTAARDSALAALREAPTPDDVETAWLRIQERFHELFATPEDVEPLRALTLELAIRGNLVEQDLEDEPASNLLARAKTKKSTLVSSSRQGRSLPPAETERPFDLPKGWSWARLDDFCDIKSGVAKGKNLQGIECQDFPYLRVANVQAGYTDLAVMKTIPLPLVELDTYRLVKGDVLLTEGGDWDKLGRSAVWGGEIEPCIHQNHVFRARSLDRGIHPRWISSFTNSPDGRAYFQSCSKQTTNLASINMTQLKSCLVPIPPSAEQDRILVRMDELMSLLDRLSESLSCQSKLAQAFSAAAVHHLDA